MCKGYEKTISQVKQTQGKIFTLVSGKGMQNNKILRYHYMSTNTAKIFKILT